MRWRSGRIGRRQPARSVALVLLCWLPAAGCAIAPGAGSPPTDSGDSRLADTPLPASDTPPADGASPDGLVSGSGEWVPGTGVRQSTGSRAPGTGELYWPDRRDYAAFQSAYPDLLEPNYLPFMVHRLPGNSVTGDDLVFCRWPAERMPLRVYIRPPIIPESLQDEFRPVLPGRFVEAVAGVLEVWEAELEGLVRFQRVAEADDADLEVRIRGETAPIREEREVLGTTTALLEACQAEGWDLDSQRLVVRFAVPELELFVADRHGLLMPKQVARVALHELGHALGMFGHSPIASDLMYRVVHDRPGAESLSRQDVNSFVSLYSLPNGSHYAQVPPGGLPERPPPMPPSGEPSLAGAPHVDVRFGFQLRVPHGWLRVETAHGLFTANGPLWDYDASIELAVWRATTLEDFLDRFSDQLLRGAWLRRRVPLVVNGRRALRIEFEDESGARAEELTLVELADARVLMIHSQCPESAGAAWLPWFRASLASLEIWTDTQ